MLQASKNRCKDNVAGVLRGSRISYMQCKTVVAVLAVTMMSLAYGHAQSASSAAWTVGTPIVTYWAGPGTTEPLNDATATQLKQGGWNLAWCRENELDVAERHGLRCQITSPLLVPATLEDPAKRAALDALIARMRSHSSLYSYFIVDEPNADQFSGLGKLVAYLRKKDPTHLAYINLFPTYASPEKQLGTHGDTVTSYQEYLDQFLETVKPQLLSYDHYQFATGHDLPDYFLNLAMVRRAALRADIPFLNIVQAATWTPKMREPNQAEMRYLVYTTLAYGAQGISYYVYYHTNHKPGIGLPNGTTTPVYDWLKILNRDFVAIASQTRQLRSIGVFNVGMQPPGTVALPSSSGFRFRHAPANRPFIKGQRVQGLLLGLFGPNGGASSPSMALAVNLDYKTSRGVTLQGPSNLDIFDASTGTWTATGHKSVQLDLLPGGGKLVRIHSAASGDASRLN